MSDSESQRRRSRSASPRRSSSSAPSATTITRDARFEELDVDSLDLVELAQIVEEDYGVEIKPRTSRTSKTVGEAIDLVVARARHEPPRRHHRRRRRHAARRGRAAPDRALGAGESGSRTASAAARSSTPTESLTRKEARRADRFTQLALAAAREALAQAGWSTAPPYEPERSAA